MEVAREEIYYPEETVKKNPKEDKLKLTKKKNRKKLQKQSKEMQKKYRREKVLFCLMIMTVTLICLGLLLRYVMITEARHDIHQLNTTIAELKNDERDLRIEVESLSRSNRVESEAINRLEMIYPDTREVNYIEVDSIAVKRIASHLENFQVQDTPEPGFIKKANDNLRQLFSKVETLF